MSNLAKMQTQEVSTTPVFAKDVVKQSMNVLRTDIITKEVSDKTVQGYYKQIAHNLTIGKKAEFLVKRDLADAKKNIQSSEFSSLGSALMELNEELTASTISKYAKIGGSDYCLELFNKGKLPMSWTTQYELAKLSAPEKEKVEEIISLDTTANDIKQILNPVEKKEEGEKDITFKPYNIENATTVFKIGISRSGIDSNKLLKLKTKLQKVVNEINDMKMGYIIDDTQKNMACELVTREKIMKKVYDANFKFFIDYKKKRYSAIHTRNSEVAWLAKRGLQHLASELGDVEMLPDESGFEEFAKVRNEIVPKGNAKSTINGIVLYDDV